jgi:alpha-L-rhamnosidase
MWERWDAGARSHDHFFLATVTDWILTRVAGVQRIGGDWSRVRVAPGLVPGVNRAASTRRTPLGDLVVEWERGGPVHLVVPQGMTCELGGENPATLGPGDHRL